MPCPIPNCLSTSKGYYYCFSNLATKLPSLWKSSSIKHEHKSKDRHLDPQWGGGEVSNRKNQIGREMGQHVGPGPLLSGGMPQPPSAPNEARFVCDRWSVWQHCCRGCCIQEKQQSCVVFLRNPLPLQNLVPHSSPGSVPSEPGV